MKVLVVDDERIIREGIVRMLVESGQGFAVMCAADAFEAMELLRKERADVVITDILMPEMDGLTLIEKIREEKLCSRFVILSGYAEFDYARKAITCGVEEYLLKPVDAQELTAVLKRIEGMKREKEGTRMTVWELDRQIAGAALSREEVRDALTVLASGTEKRAPQSMRMRLLLQLYLLYPDRKESFSELLTQEGAAPEEEVAVQLYRLLERLVNGGELSASVGRALTLVAGEYQNPRMSLSWAAERIFVNPNYLSGLFTRSLGVSFNMLVRLLRVSFAQQLLKGQEELSIREISGRCGFGNENLFFRTFRSLAQKTPMSYKTDGI